MAGDPNTNLVKGAEIEYAALRGEILKRIEIRHQLMSVTLTLAGIFLTIGLANPTVAFVYPVLATFLAAGWAQNDIRVGQMGQYIRERLEDLLPGLGWEQYRRDKESETRVGRWPIVILSPSGILLFTQTLAIGVGIYKFTSSILEWILLVIDVVVMLLTVALMIYVRRQGDIMLRHNGKVAKRQAR